MEIQLFLKHIYTNLFTKNPYSLRMFLSKQYCSSSGNSQLLHLSPQVPKKYENMYPNVKTQGRRQFSGTCIFVLFIF